MERLLGGRRAGSLRIGVAKASHLASGGAPIDERAERSSHLLFGLLGRESRLLRRKHHSPDSDFLRRRGREEEAQKRNSSSCERGKNGSANMSSGKPAAAVAAVAALAAAMAAMAAGAGAGAGSNSRCNRCSSSRCSSRCRCSSSSSSVIHAVRLPQSEPRTSPHADSPISQWPPARRSHASAMARRHLQLCYPRLRK